MSTRITRTALGLSAGFLIWAAHFTLIYALTAVTCSRGYIGVGTLRTSLFAATVVALILTFAVLPRALKPRSGRTLSFLGETGALVAGLAMIGILWNAVPVLFLPVCR